MVCPRGTAVPPSTGSAEPITQATQSAEYKQVTVLFADVVHSMDGIMAVFGAPVVLEDRAVRACLAALGIQDETARLATEVKDRDGIDLRLRVGLNSGQVIAGEIVRGLSDKPPSVSRWGWHSGWSRLLRPVG